jgi:hypothetical protein
MLKDRLDRIRTQFTATAPESAQAVMHRATSDLRASGIMDRIPAPGTELPAFELHDSAGELVRSTELLAEGPLVLSFYRGVW